MGINPVLSQQILSGKTEFDRRLLSSSPQSQGHDHEGLALSKLKPPATEGTTHRKQCATATVSSRFALLKPTAAAAPGPTLLAHFQSTEGLAGQAERLRFNKSLNAFNKDMDALDLSNHSISLGKDKRAAAKPAKMTEKAAMAIRNHISRLQRKDSATPSTKMPSREAPRTKPDMQRTETSKEAARAEPQSYFTSLSSKGGYICQAKKQSWFAASRGQTQSMLAAGKGKSTSAVSHRKHPEQIVSFLNSPTERPRLELKPCTKAQPKSKDLRDSKLRAAKSDKCTPKSRARQAASQQ